MPPIAVSVPEVQQAPSSVLESTYGSNPPLQVVEPTASQVVGLLLLAVGTLKGLQSLYLRLSPENQLQLTGYILAQTEVLLDNLRKEGYDTVNLPPTSASDGVRVTFEKLHSNYERCKADHDLLAEEILHKGWASRLCKLLKLLKDLHGLTRLCVESHKDTLTTTNQLRKEKNEIRMREELEARLQQEKRDRWYAEGNNDPGEFFQHPLPPQQSLEDLD
ncbi:hypothetical protein PHLCEN_2v10473 [Hermanssonia centrifuga]|uniref:Uncharacterized protein n=1 Tax=Hermanssonia centrifuga TaxID=98765 RepID=A0A2R6NMD7_9APHY|nr:hypothetical protein PHLCEN_2v10473 [Hermanssonia centrifuga]